MELLGENWGTIASPKTALIIGFSIMATSFFLRGFKKDDGSLDGEKLLSIFTICISIYIFGVLISNQLLLNAKPGIPNLIEHGFGPERFAYVLSGVWLVQLIKFVDLFVLSNGEKK